MSAIKSVLLILFLFAVGCGDYDGEGEADTGQDIGQAQQAVGIKVGSSRAFGVTTTAVHGQSRCTNGGVNTVCSVPQTKGPTYFLASSLSANEKSNARIAFAYLDGKSNWTFTETTDSSTAVLTVNRIDNFCTGALIQDLVCVNLSGQGNTLSEPTPIPNVYTEHSNGIIHVDRAAINASTADATDRGFRTYHGLLAAILSWMGLGTVSGNGGSPSRATVLTPDLVTDLTAGEICALNGFLPKAQFGAANTIGIVSNCGAD